ncbi:MAG: ABC transporter substrate-binding protein [Rivularia sp. (in: Bacteria)]|nr:ABC transporter substrate-binding protein [Rivularia sp. MS3]
MLRDLLEVAKKLFEVTDGLKQAKHEKRQKLEKFFNEIGQCLRDSAEVLNNGQTPRIKAKALKVYAEELPNILNDVYDENKVSELSHLLNNAANKIGANNTPEDYVKEIEAAAGMFKALAVIVATQPELNSQNKKKENSKPFLSLPTNRRNFLSTAALTSVGVISGGLASQYMQMPIVSWKMASFLDESNKLILAKAPKIIRERINLITGGRFNIELYQEKTILTEQILNKVNEGKIQCGFSGIYYNNSRYKVLFFGSSIPHGLTPQEQTAWLLYKKESDNKFTFIQEIYKKVGLNVIPFPAAATGAQMGGWFKKEVEKIQDFDGITMRIPGLGGEVLTRFNVRLDKEFPDGAIPTSKITEAFKTGIIQAAEWVGPYDDFELGLHEAGAKYYYYPGWWEPSTTFDMVVNQDAWNSLPSHYQQIFQAVCLQTYTEILAEYNQKNSKQLEKVLELERSGKITLKRFSSEIIRETERKTEQLLKEYASVNKLFNDVYDEWLGFKNRIREWSKLG